MRRSVYSLYAIFVILALVLSACAPAATPTPAAVATKSQVEPTKAVPPTTAPAATTAPTKIPDPTKAPEPTKAPTAVSKQGEVVISRPGRPEPWQAVADAYMKINPGVKVTVDMKPADGYAEWVRAQFASGTPKASLMQDNVVLDLVNAGRFLDFRSYFDKTNPYTSKKWGDDLNYKSTQRFYGPFGEVWWLGYEQNKVFWVYNKAVFDKAGVKEAPKNWDEMVSACTKIKAAGYTPMAMAGNLTSLWSGNSAKFAWIYTDQFTRDWINTARAQPGDWNFDANKDGKFKYDPKDPFNDDAGNVNVNWVRLLAGIRDGKLKFTNDAWKELYTNLAQAIPQCMPDGFFGMDDNQAYQLFLTQKAAMYWTDGGFVTRFGADISALQKGSDKATAVPTAQAFDFGLFSNPGMTTKNAQSPVRTIESTGGYLAVPVKDPKQNDLEVDFLMFLSSPQGYQAFIDGQVAIGGLTALPIAPILEKVKLTDADLKRWKVVSDMPIMGSVQGDTKISARIGRALWDDQESVRLWVDLMTKYFQKQITVDQFAEGYESLMKNAVPRVADRFKWTNADLDHPERRPGQ
jgi:raffinose/stachyose/melibiose transport system substrate-binding protein